MDSQRWRQIEELYNAAQACEPAERARLLDQADPEVKHNVERMLAQSGSVLDRPAWDALSENTATMLAAGNRLGRYEIETRLGAGGMGEVFRARDVRLGRKVAIKTSHERFSSRFENEARAISALNHPHICTLYDVGPNYLVMELVEGETISARLKRGTLPLSEALRWGAQIAEALAEAHAHGIVHRDLKPSNVMLTPRGVKVLDFGLAKMPSQDALTETDVAIGTPAYMAPEQIDRREADARTDLFALGLVLYEMVAGNPPFPGASLGQMLASGARPSVEPPCKVGSKGGSRLNALIFALIEKDPARRPRSADFARQELIQLAETGVQHRSAKAFVAIGAAAFLSLVALGLWWAYRSNGFTRRWPEASRVSLITTDAGTEATPAVSVDGVWVAFSSKGEQGAHSDIYVTRSDGLEQPRPLTHDSSEDSADLFPAWSPDGRRIAFVRRHGATGGEIIVIPAAGGAERKLREIRFLAFPAANWLAWTPNGEEIVFASASLETGRSTLFVLRLADGSVRTLTSPPDGVIGDASPALSSDGRSLAYLRWSSPEISTLLVQKLGTDGKRQGAATAVTNGLGSALSPAWVDNRRLIFLTRQRIMEWEAGVAPRQIYLSSSRLAGLAAAGRDAEGIPRLVTAQYNNSSDRIWVIPLRGAGTAGGTPELFSQLGNDSRNPDFSPDGKSLVFVSQRTGPPELWTASARGEDLRQLTKLGLKSLGVPRWSPDGQRIAFFARTDAEPQIYAVDARPEAVPRKLTNEVPGCNIPTWSRDGKFVYCSRRIDGEMRLYRVAAAGAEAGQTEMERWFEGKEARETSDGRLLYIKDDRPGLFTRSLAGDPTANPEERLVEDIKGPIAYFAPVAQGVYYTGQDALGHYAALRFFDYARRQKVDLAPRVITGDVNSLTVSPDGHTLLYTQTKGPQSQMELTLIQF